MTFSIRPNEDFRTGDRWVLYIDGERSITGPSPDWLAKHVERIIRIRSGMQ